MLWTMVLLLLPGVAADVAVKSKPPAEEDNFLMVLSTLLCLLASTFFMLGRWSRAEVRALPEPKLMTPLCPAGCGLR